MADNIKYIRVLNNKIDIDKIDIEGFIDIVSKRDIEDYKVSVNDKHINYGRYSKYNGNNTIIEIATDNYSLGFIKDKLVYVICFCEEDIDIEMIDTKGNNVRFYDKFNIAYIINDKIKNIKNNQSILIEDILENNYRLKVGKVNEKYFLCLEIKR